MAEVRAGFEHLNIYDGPEVALKQLVSGTGSWDSMVAGFMGRAEQLTPLQRQTWTARLQAATGNHGITDALIGIATNPWVWAGFAFTPAGSEAIRSMRLGDSFMGWAKNTMVPWALKNFNQLVAGTPFQHVVGYIGNTKNVLDREWHLIVKKGQEDIAARLGVSTRELVDPARIKDPVLRDKVLRTNQAFQYLSSPHAAGASYAAPRYGPELRIIDTFKGEKRIRRLIPINVAKSGSRFVDAHDIALNPAYYDAIQQALQADKGKRSPFALEALLNSRSTRAARWRSFGYDDIQSRAVDIFRREHSPTGSQIEDFKRALSEIGGGDGNLFALNGGAYYEVPNAITRQPWVRDKALLEDWLRTNVPEALDLIPKVREALNTRMARLVGRSGVSGQELATAFARDPEEFRALLDPDKILRLWRGRYDVKSYARSADAPEDFVLSLLERGVPDALSRPLRETRGAPVNPWDYIDELEAAVVNGFAATADLGSFFPVGVRDFYEGISTSAHSGFNALRRLRPSRMSLARSDSGVLTLSTKGRDPTAASGHATPLQGEVDFHPEDLEEFRRLWGPNQMTDAFNEQLRTSRNKYNPTYLAQEKAGIVGFQRINPFRTLARYHNQTALDYILHAAPLPDYFPIKMRQTFETLYKSFEVELKKREGRAFQPTVYPTTGATYPPGLSRSRESQDWAMLASRAPTPEAREYARKMSDFVDTWDRSLLNPRMVGRPATFESRSELARLKGADPSARYGEFTDMAGPLGGHSIADIAAQTDQLLQEIGDMGVVRGGERAARNFRETGLPLLFGQLGPDGSWYAPGAIMSFLLGNSLEGLQRLSRTDLFKSINKDFAASVDDFAARQLRELDEFDLAARTDREVASWIYSSTLGLNTASVLLNITQPFMHTAAYFGLRETLYGYREGLADLAAYSRSRFSGPYRNKLRLSPAERMEVLQDAGRDLPRIFDTAGITGDVLEELDELAYASLAPGSGRSRFKFWAQDMPLKMFEKGEWLNRIVTARAVEKNFVDSGRLAYTRPGVVRTTTAPGPSGEGITSAIGLDDISAEISRAVQETQFGAGAANTPMFLARTSPLLRQFLTFTLRTPLSILELGPRIGGGARRLRGTNLMAPWWVGDSLRLMGISSILYESYKGLGLDPENVGIAPTVSDVWGGYDFLDTPSDRPLPYVPPVLDIGLDYLGGIFGTEKQLLGDALARSVPGGIAIQRALGVAPNADEALWNLGYIPQALQKNYVDWTNPTPDGRYPLYKADGSLIDYQPGYSLILKGLGVKLDAHRHAARFDNFLRTNRDKFTEQERRFLEALYVGDVSGANRINRSFQRQFGVPITISSTQLKAFNDSKSVTRTERMVDRMPAAVRDQYLALLESQGPRLGIQSPPQIRYGTATQRRASGPAIGSTPRAFSPEELAVLRSHLESSPSQQADAIQRQTGYSPYSAF